VITVTKQWREALRAHGQRLALIGTHLVCALFVLSASLLAQPPEAYLRLVDTYAAGDIQSAVSQLDCWSRAQVLEAVEPILRTAEQRPPFASVPVVSPRLYAAAMLETDLAAALLSPSSDVTT
jgi:hypothetical protein